MSGWWAVLLCALLPGVARAQHFAGALPAGTEPGPLTLLEDAQAPRSAALSWSVLETRWWGVPELRTRAVACGVGVRSLRVGVGLSQTGEPAIGFTTLAAAAGVASPIAGAAVRAASWLDRTDADWTFTRATSSVAAHEAGAGAWLVPANGVRVWIDAPRLASRGSPPLARPMELGVRAGGEDAVWCVLRAPRTGDDGERALGAALAIAPLALWVELRDAPLRSAAGVRLAWRGLQIALRLDEHPVLGETVRTELGWALGRRAS